MASAPIWVPVEVNGWGSGPAAPHVVNVPPAPAPHTMTMPTPAPVAATTRSGTRLRWGIAIAALALMVVATAATSFGWFTTSRDLSATQERLNAANQTISSLQGQIAAKDSTIATLQGQVQGTQHRNARLAGLVQDAKDCINTIAQSAVDAGNGLWATASSELQSVTQRCTRVVNANVTSSAAPG